MKYRQPALAAVDEASVERLRAALEADQRVVFAYLFGSHATGSAGPRSDVDVGVYVSSMDPDPLLDLIGTVTSALHRDDVDVVLLNSAPLTLAFEVLKGRLLFSKSEDARVAAEAAIMSRYHDRAYYMRRHLREFAEALRERGFA